MAKKTGRMFFGILFAAGVFIGVTDGELICEASSTGVFQKGTWYLDFDGDGVPDCLDQFYSQPSIKTLTFDPTTDERVVGYKLHYGQSPNFDIVIDLYNNTKYDLVDLAEGATYYFAVSAYDAFGNESALSEVLVYTFNDCAGSFGLPDDLPVAGDWTNTWTAKIGVYRPSTGMWYLDDGDGIWSGCGTDLCIGPFGLPGDLPVAGDWTNTGTAKIGVYRPSTGMWYLDDGDGIWSDCETDICIGPFGLTGDLPVAGDWTNTGTGKIGVYRPTTGMWYLDDGDGIWSDCETDICIGPFGLTGDLPVVGDWNNTVSSKIGVYRPSTGMWYLDDGDGIWSACGTDICIGPFGLIGDIPVAGIW